jgi:polysaccharide chain length determinant protein (PEP-CTERM system associated)
VQFWKSQILTYLTGAWHYRWHGLVIAWAVCVLGWIGVGLIPNTYQAVAKVYIDTDTLMGPLLRGLTVSTDPEQTVSIMLNTLVTRPNLEQVVHLTDPHSTAQGESQLQTAVQRLQDNIALKPLGSKNLYEISFANHDPEYALKVTQSLLSILVDSNIGDKRRDMEDAQSFIDNKLSEYETLLREAEKRRADFKTAHLDLFSGGPADARIDVANGRIGAAQQALGAAIARHDSIAAQLSGMPKTTMIDAPGALNVNGVQVGGGAGQGSALMRLGQAKQSLVELQSKYTDDFPDIVATKHLIAQLENELRSSPSANEGGSASIPNPVYIALQAKLSDAATEVAFERHNLDVAKQDLEKAKAVTATAIEIETKYADLDRDYDIIHRNYQDLLSRREAARLSQAVDDRQETIAFRVVEAPMKAVFPVAPDRQLLDSIVLLVGTVAGVIVAVGLSLLAGRFVSSDQLAAEFDYPIIGVVSRMRTIGDTIRAARSALMVGASFGGLVLCYFILAVLLNPTVQTAIGRII